ncbi:MAG: ethanolamine utilization protein EutJ [Opitutia bacterium Tous-C1TDCM]|nr:MAG: ethanolamine utilization protein EutJ [Opitutae bacterium Tous-C1TDCM]
MKSPLLFLTLAATALALRAAEPIKVGEFASLTGKDATFGQSQHKGIVLALEEINAAGGVLGRKLEVIAEDNQSKAGESATAAKKLLSRDKVVALLGEVTSSRSLEVAPLAQSAKIPMIASGATNPAVTQKGDYIFRVCFIDDFQGTVMAKFALTELKAKKVATLTSVSSAYSVGLAKYFKETFTAGGGTVVAEQKFNEGDKDFRAQLTAIKAANVDAVFVPGYYTEAALVARQARSLGINIPLFGGDGWESEKLLEIGGAALNGTYYSTHFTPENKEPAVAVFVKKFKARWNNETPDAYAALGYDSLYILVDAIRRSGVTAGPKLRDAIATTRNFSGASGVTTLDKDRNASKPATIIAIKDAKLHFHKTVAP